MVREGHTLMTKTKFMTVLMIAAAGPAFSAPANAQSIMTGRTAFDNLSGSYASERVPGAMVAAGFGRAQAAADAGRAQVHSPDITETEPPTSIRDEFMVGALQTVIEQLMNTLMFLGNRLLARAGLMDLLPPETFFPDAGTGGGGGSADDGTDSSDSGTGSDGSDSADRDDRTRTDRT